MNCACCGAAPPAVRVMAVAATWGLCSPCIDRAPKRAAGCIQVCEVCDQQRIGTPRLAEWAICTPHGPRASRFVCGHCLEPVRAALAEPAAPAEH